MNCLNLSVCLASWVSADDSDQMCGCCDTTCSIRRGRDQPLKGLQSFFFFFFFLYIYFFCHGLFVPQICGGIEHLLGPSMLRNMAMAENNEVPCDLLT